MENILFNIFTNLYFDEIIKKTFFFRKIIYKNKKALQLRPKGWKYFSSPYWIASELLRGI